MDKRFEEFYNIIDSNPRLTEREIAERAGLKKTPYSRWILLSLIQSGYVLRHWQEDRQPRPAYVFYVNDMIPLFPQTET